ncbi:hypothetical protein K525DRAFT_274789 [Schizophyllum commune Loenen D]|nr:hypothetical protein K525DRAFT_274789 [Schizophyllum commune Loenen D]
MDPLDKHLFGPSVVIAYLSYRSEDVPALEVLKETKLAGDTSYWALYCRDPSRDTTNLKAFQLDSDAPSGVRPDSLDADTDRRIRYESSTSLFGAFTHRTNLRAFLDGQKHLFQSPHAKPRIAAELIVVSLDAMPLMILYTSDGGNAGKLGQRAEARGLLVIAGPFDSVPASIRAPPERRRHARRPSGDLCRSVGTPYAGDLVAALVVGSASGEAGVSNDIASTALTQLLALPKAGKMAGAEHRAALYAMVGRVPALPALQPGLPLLGKETHDAPLNALTAALRAALTVVSQASYLSPTTPQQLSSPSWRTRRRPPGAQVSRLHAERCGNLPPPPPSPHSSQLSPPPSSRSLRARICPAKGGTPQQCCCETRRTRQDTVGPRAKGHARVDVGFRNNSYRTTAKAGAKAGAASKGVGTKDKASPAPAAAGGKSTPGKSAHHASSLVNKRVYGKVLREGSPSDLLWLARAGVATLEAFAVEVASKADVNLAPLGTMLAHLATRAADHRVWGESNALVSGAAGRAGKTVSAAICAGVLDLVTEEEVKEKEKSGSSSVKKTTEDADAAKADKPFPVERLRALVQASVSFGEAASPKLKLEELSAWLVPTHHDITSGPAGGKNKTSAWIGLGGRTGMDPREDVNPLEITDAEPEPITNKRIMAVLNFLRSTIVEGLQDATAGTSNAQLTKFYANFRFVFDAAQNNNKQTLRMCEHLGMFLG